MRDKSKAKRPQCTKKVTRKEKVSQHLSVMVKRFLPAMLLAIPLLITISVYQWIKNPENLTIESVEIVGDLKVLDQEQLQPIIEAYTKTNLYLLNEDGLEKAIEENPWVYSASLMQRWPNNLVIKIHEQNAVAHWGKTEMLAENGEIIKATLSTKNSNLPLLHSPNEKGRSMATGFLKIREMMKAFPVKLVEFKEDTRGSWKIKLENGMTLKIGREHQDKRLKRFMVAYEESLNAVIDKISIVDLRYTNGFAVKWKNGLSVDSIFKG